MTLDEAISVIHELRAQVATLTVQLAKANERIAELEAAAGRKKRDKKEKKSAEPPAPPATNTEAAKAFAERPQPPAKPPEPETPPTEQRRPGRHPLPVHLPEERWAAAPVTCCGACSHTGFDCVDEFIEEKLTVVKAHQRRRVAVRRTWRCRHCLLRTTSLAPPAPFERSKVTCEWLAWFITERASKLCTIDRIRRHLALQGVILSMSFLVSMLAKGAQLLAAIDGEHWRDLLAGAFLATDGTGLKVQVPEVGLHHGYLEVYHRDDIIVFQYEAEKGGDTQAKKLVRFKGIIQVDAESRYNLTFASGRIIEAGCNAHPRRALRDAEDVQPELAVEAGRFIGAIFGAEEQARTAGLRSDALKKWRQEKIRPLFAQFRVWMEAVLPILIPSDLLAKAIRYYQNHWAALTLFIDHPEVPIDNSASERLFQPVAKLRLNSLFAGSTEGAHSLATILGIVATCRKQGVDPEGYLAWAFERQGTWKERYKMSAAELTPAAYKRSLAEQRRAA